MEHKTEVKPIDVKVLLGKERIIGIIDQLIERIEKTVKNPKENFLTKSSSSSLNGTSSKAKKFFNKVNQKAKKKAENLLSNGVAFMSQDKIETLRNLKEDLRGFTGDFNLKNQAHVLKQIQEACYIKRNPLDKKTPQSVDDFKTLLKAACEEAKKASSSTVKNEELEAKVMAEPQISQGELDISSYANFGRVVAKSYSNAFLLGEDLDENGQYKIHIRGNSPENREFFKKAFPNRQLTSEEAAISISQEEIFKFLGENYSVLDDPKTTDNKELLTKDELEDAKQGLIITPYLSYEKVSDIELINSSTNVYKVSYKESPSPYMIDLSNKPKTEDNNKVAVMGVGELRSAAKRAQKEKAQFDNIMRTRFAQIIEEEYKNAFYLKSDYSDENKKGRHEIHIQKDTDKNREEFKKAFPNRKLQQGKAVIWEEKIFKFIAKNYSSFEKDRRENSSLTDDEMKKAKQALANSSAFPNDGIIDIELIKSSTSVYKVYYKEESTSYQNTRRVKNDNKITVMSAGALRDLIGKAELLELSKNNPIHFTFFHAPKTVDGECKVIYVSELQETPYAIVFDSLDQANRFISACDVDGELPNNTEIKVSELSHGQLIDQTLIGKPCVYLTEKQLSAIAADESDKFPAEIREQYEELHKNTYNF